MQGLFLIFPISVQGRLFVDKQSPLNSNVYHPKVLLIGMSCQ